MKRIAFISFLVLIAACNYEESSDNQANLSKKPANLTYYEPFKASSPFYEPIPTSAKADPNSSTMVGSFVDKAVNHAFIVVVKEWTTTVFLLIKIHQLMMLKSRNLGLLLKNC